MRDIIDWDYREDGRYEKDIQNELPKPNDKNWIQRLLNL